MLLKLSISPKNRLTIIYGVSFNKVVELARGESVIRGATLLVGPVTFVFSCDIINRPGVAGAVLQTPSGLIDLLNESVIKTSKSCRRADARPRKII